MENKSSIQDVFWKIFYVGLILLIITWQFKDCGGKSKKERFIENLMDDGYSREDAEEEYEDVALDSWMD